MPKYKIGDYIYTPTRKSRHGSPACGKITDVQQDGRYKIVLYGLVGPGDEYFFMDVPEEDLVLQGKGD